MRARPAKAGEHSVIFRHIRPQEYGACQRFLLGAQALTPQPANDELQGEDYGTDDTRALHGVLLSAEVDPAAAVPRCRMGCWPDATPAGS
jgi:hypothetical protein